MAVIYDQALNLSATSAGTVSESTAAADATDTGVPPAIDKQGHEGDMQSTANSIAEEQPSITHLVLSEHESRTVELSAEQAAALNKVGGGCYLSVEPCTQSGLWRVSAHHYVGSINVAGLQVLVKPKIPLENLFLMLEVGLRPRDWKDEVVSYQKTSDLLPAFVSFFARTTETTLARGLYHSYREHQDRLIALRGRVDIARQLAQPGVVIPTACRFTEFTAEVIENTYLKAAVSRARRVARVPAEDRRRLMKHLVALEDVSDVLHHHSDHERLVFTRLNEHYKPALRLAQLILANLTLKDDIGGMQTSAFMLDMNELFERFVTERLRRELRGRLGVDSQHSATLDKDRRVPIRPDLLFRSAGEPSFVADVKYKLTDDKATGRNPDYYQLLAYTTALELRQGALIYCLGADSGQERQAAGGPGAPVRVRHTDKSLHTYALDLSGDAEQVAGNLKHLADWIQRMSAPGGAALDSASREQSGVAHDR